MRHREFRNVSTTRIICFVAGFLAYQVFVFVFGAALNATGHGTAFFFEVVLAPFSGTDNPLALLGLAQWVALALLLGFRHVYRCKVAAAIILLIHCVGVSHLCMNADWNDVGRVWRNSGFILVLPWLAAYLGSQIFMWALIFQKRPLN